MTIENIKIILSKAEDSELSSFFFHRLDKSFCAAAAISNITSGYKNRVSFSINLKQIDLSYAKNYLSQENSIFLTLSSEETPKKDEIKSISFKRTRISLLVMLSFKGESYFIEIRENIEELICLFFAKNPHDYFSTLESF